MRIDLTVFDNKEAEVICDIIYEKLCDLGLNPEGFTWLINVEVNHTSKHDKNNKKGKTNGVTEQTNQSASSSR